MTYNNRAMHTPYPQAHAMLADLEAQLHQSLEQRRAGAVTDFIIAVKSRIGSRSFSEMGIDDAYYDALAWACPCSGSIALQNRALRRAQDRIRQDGDCPPPVRALIQMRWAQEARHHSGIGSETARLLTAYTAFSIPGCVPDGRWFWKAFQDALAIRQPEPMARLLRGFEKVVAIRCEHADPEHDHWFGLRYALSGSPKSDDHPEFCDWHRRVRALLPPEPPRVVRDISPEQMADFRARSSLGFGRGSSRRPVDTADAGRSPAVRIMGPWKLP